MSLICARLSPERALFSAVEAVMKSFCACTMSVASIVNSGWPTVTDLAGLDEKLGDAAGIRRKHRRRTIFVDRDLALGHMLGAKHLLLAGFDCQRRPLGGTRIEQPARTLRLARHRTVGVAGPRRGLRLEHPEKIPPAISSDAIASARSRGGQARSRRSGRVGIAGHFVSYGVLLRRYTSSITPARSYKASMNGSGTARQLFRSVACRAHRPRPVTDVNASIPMRIVAAIAIRTKLMNLRPRRCADRDCSPATVPLRCTIAWTSRG